jgi:hypothetical protein
VLNQSPLFIDVIRGCTPKVSFTVNGCKHHMRYYLTDGIYPSWSVFVKGVSIPQQEKHRFFSMKQALMRKDVECAFGLLKKRFNILSISGRSYSQHILDLIMRACIILHNKIIDNERDGGYDDNYHTVTSIVALPINFFLFWPFCNHYLRNEPDETFFSPNLTLLSRANPSGATDEGVTPI